MRVMIMGAGAQGSATASILAKDDFVDEVILADIDKGLADKVADKVKSDKITTIKVNADNIDEIAAAAKGSAVIMDFVMPWHAVNVMKAALQVGAHYVNTAFDSPFWDQLVNGEELTLQKEFTDAGLTALLGCGSTPGLFNAIIRLYADKFDTIDTIQLRCLQKKDDSLEAMIRPWNPGWAPAQAIIDFATPPMIFKDGKYQTTELFGDPEMYDFGGILPGCPAVYHSHEEVYSLPYSFKSKGIKNCNFKYLLDAQAATFVCMGFTPDNEIEVKGQKIKPFDVLIALTEHPGDYFFEEEPPTSNEVGDPEWGMSVEVYGTIDGKDDCYKVWVPGFFMYPMEVYESCGTTLVSVALPATIGMKMCVEGAKAGVIFAEELDPNRFLELLKEKVPSFELTEF